jgi:replicative DNA helicase
MARHLTRKAHTGLLFELEMCTEELGDRLLAAEAGVDTHDIEEGRLIEDRMSAVVQAAARIHEFALYIDDTPQLPIHILAARARAFHAKKPLSFVLVDYLQLVKPSRRGHSRESEVSEISGSLLGLAKSLRVPVICCCQFNREAADREPRMDDLRESGAIEQDAAKIIALHPVPDDPKNPIPPERKAVHQQTKVLVLKNRRGPTGWAMLNFRKRSTTFVEEDRR